MNAAVNKQKNPLLQNKRTTEDQTQGDTQPQLCTVSQRKQLFADFCTGLGNSSTTGLSCSEKCQKQVCHQETVFLSMSLRPKPTLCTCDLPASRFVLVGEERVSARHLHQRAVPGPGRRRRCQRVRPDGGAQHAAATRRAAENHRTTSNRNS